MIRSVKERQTVPASNRFRSGMFPFLFVIFLLIAGCGGTTVSGAGNTNSTNTGNTATDSTLQGSTAVLAWDAAVTRTDGTQLTGEVVYKLYYGTASGQYSAVLEVGSQTSATVTGLAPGTYYFVVTACDILGLESGYSNEVSRVI